MLIRAWAELIFVERILPKLNNCCPATSVVSLDVSGSCREDFGPGYGRGDAW